MSKKELDARGWDCADVILFTGDAYVDHPSFGAAVIGRLLESRGYRVAIVAQPNWRDDLRDFKKLGKPRLFFGITAGCMDSMVNHYTANRRLRSDDAYTADALAGQRPDYAVTVYTKIVKQLFPDVPVVLGGIEASLRRFTHYDYWTDTLKPSVLVDSGADLLVYGLGEKPILEIADRLARGEKIDQLRNVRQTAFVSSTGFQPVNKVGGASCSPRRELEAPATFQTHGLAARATTEIRTLHSFAECLADKKKFAENFRIIEEESNRTTPATLIEPLDSPATPAAYPFCNVEAISSQSPPLECGGRGSEATGDTALSNSQMEIASESGVATSLCRRTPKKASSSQNAHAPAPAATRAIIVTPPFPAMSETETDASFDLPYTRMPHPRYRGKRIPAYDMIRHSVTLHRGCFGGCSFCTISAHQGKFISSRSEKSIMREVEKVTQMPDFAGNISDLGGPSANMYGLRGKDETICAQCRRPSCLHPLLCRNLDTNHTRLTALYRKVLAHPKVKRAFVGSGIRYDIFLDENGFRSPDGADYFAQLVRHHVSGRLKVAPEHSSEKVLRHIRKPSFKLFETLKSAFDEINTRENLRQQLIPYFISSLPYCEEKDMAALRADLKRLGYSHLEQVQDFTPTPMTLDSAIYHSGIDPYTGKPALIARTPAEKLTQRAYLLGTRMPDSKRRSPAAGRGSAAPLWNL